MKENYFTPIKEVIAHSEAIPERKAMLDAARVELLRDEVKALRARIAELEKAREVIGTGWMIVRPAQNSHRMCGDICETPTHAWKAFCLGRDQARYEDFGYRAVKVAVVRVEE